jgi:acetyl esterase/lipase
MRSDLEMRSRLLERLGMPHFTRGWFLFAICLVSLRGADPAVRVTHDVTYLAADRVEKLDLYLPATPAAGKLSPAVVWIHGGGWTGGTKSEARAKEICTTLANAGYVAVSIDYKLGDGVWPTNLFDCKNAVRFLRAHAKDYHLDPQRIAVAGGSAGGHLALMVGLTAGKKELEPESPYPGVSSAVRCVIDMYGPTDMLTRRQIAPDGTPLEERRPIEIMLKIFAVTSEQDPVLKLASPVTHVAKNSPPVLILHGRADTTVDYTQSEELVRVMKERGAPHEFVLIDGVGHTFGWETWGKKKMARDLRPLALEFLAKNMK